MTAGPLGPFAATTTALVALFGGAGLTYWGTEVAVPAEYIEHISDALRETSTDPATEAVRPAEPQSHASSDADEAVFSYHTPLCFPGAVNCALDWQSLGLRFKSTINQCIARTAMSVSSEAVPAPVAAKVVGVAFLLDFLLMLGTIFFGAGFVRRGFTWLRWSRTSGEAVVNDFLPTVASQGQENYTAAEDEDQLMHEVMQEVLNLTQRRHSEQQAQLEKLNTMRGTTLSTDAFSFRAASCSPISTLPLLSPSNAQALFRPRRWSMPPGVPFALLHDGLGDETDFPSLGAQSAADEGGSELLSDRLWTAPDPCIIDYTSPVCTDPLSGRSISPAATPPLTLRPPALIRRRTPDLHARRHPESCPSLQHLQQPDFGGSSRHNGPSYERALFQDENDDCASIRDASGTSGHQERCQGSPLVDKAWNSPLRRKPWRLSIAERESCKIRRESNMQRHFQQCDDYAQSPDQTPPVALREIDGYILG